tara:strand:- start:4651 stop:5289 length:639 start_codon:yes stop_codon:yes gene_type:complete
MDNEKYAQDLNHIKNMMNRSTRFISLSGLSGVFAGCYALVGAAVAATILSGSESYSGNYEQLESTFKFSEVLESLILVAISVLILAIGTAIFFTTLKAKKNDQKIWDSTSKRILINFFGPLIIGGCFCLVLLQFQLVGLVAPGMLIFYGLALIHASKYTFDDLKGLGYANAILGLIATQFIGYGLYFWALGFGIFHIIYGILMYNKFDKKSA